jgi:hypothetical protein
MVTLDKFVHNRNCVLGENLGNSGGSKAPIHQNKNNRIIK